MIETKCPQCGSEDMIIQGGNCSTCLSCGSSSCAVA